MSSYASNSNHTFASLQMHTNTDYKIEQFQSSVVHWFRALPISRSGSLVPGFLGDRLGVYLGSHGLTTGRTGYFDKAWILSLGYWSEPVLVIRREEHTSHSNGLSFVNKISSVMIGSEAEEET